jgi:hypothetical protein
MDSAFEVHKLNPGGLAKADAIASLFDACLSGAAEIVGSQSREFALVRTHMETACFFAKKAMAQAPENWQ